MLAAASRPVNRRRKFGVDDLATAIKAERRTLTRPGAALDALIALCADDLRLVNAIVLEHMQSEVALVPQLAGHIIAAGGKRLRPMLTLACARLVGYAGQRHLALAAAVEFIHTATLLHDDVVDESGLRRGAETANALWGNKASVLVGDFLFSRAFQLMVADGSLAVLKVLAEASATIAEGEVRQMMTANNTATVEREYLEVIEAKTAALFAAACRIGALVADRPQVEEEALARFGRSLGIAYQLTDDALDYSANNFDLGKRAGDDFRDGKLTLPVLLAFARGDAEERAFWRRVLEDQDQRDGDFEHALAILRRHGTIAETVERARAQGTEARRALARFPDGPTRQALLDLVEFSVERAR
ncbi:MAG: polyprenyl synthetase family protein [Alphaproteobacteria bacterium]|nr:polyprenyl synthetase family protein [Alphaproteobacteria bacterium]